ncbi:Scramblase [Oesophagostomum dentatum]|uniref:Phospholipid scramblase n=1 Tax=Oesophagostomum dentatum TaxID=61180 RepID=A0A0B1TAZ9_OESDE|nr:Scramblase [Oesophagostomum dentatum]
MSADDIIPELSVPPPKGKSMSAETAPGDSVPPPPGALVVRQQFVHPQMQNPSMPPSRGGSNEVVTTQPGAFTRPAIICMPAPDPIEGVPPGLEYLTMVDKIMVYQEVLVIRRPFKCCGGGCDGIFANFRCCAVECTVESPPGRVIGTITQRRACCATALDIENANGEKILQTKGPCCCLMCGCQDKVFPIVTLSGQEIGSITKKWAGCAREAFTDTDIFSVTCEFHYSVSFHI